MTEPPQGLSIYETWVVTLRAWALDPRTPLDRLPALDVDSFTPGTYRRLLDHLYAALETTTERWRNALLDLVGRVSRSDELATGLVDLRHTLVRRVELVSHPGLPVEIRDVLTTQNRTEIERLQQEFEKGIADRARSGHVVNTEVDRILAIARENSFMAVLDRELRWDGAAITGRAAPPPPPLPVARPSADPRIRRYRRRIAPPKHSH